MINSSTFWLVLGVSVPLFWVLPGRYRMGFLALTSFGYLFTVAPESVSALLAWSLLVFFLAPATQRGRAGRLGLLIGSILAVVAFLASFKYLPGVTAGLLGDDVVSRVAIPLGISYYSFKLIHYLAEVARGNLQGHSLQQFLCFMLLFPIFSAGPIERFDHFLENQESQWQLDSTVEGLTRIVHGLIKKFTIASLLAEWLIPAQEVSGFLDGLGTMPVWAVWARVVAMYLYVYFDFSAYSDIVIGCSRLFGLRIGENFNFPLVAANIRDYWRRWHMSLSGWCQSYVYMPVLGLTRRPLLALYSSFFVMGVWHAATFQRLAWGAYHATGVAIFTAWHRYRGSKRRALHPWLQRSLSIAMTQLFVCGSMTFLIAEARGGVYGALRILFKLAFIELPG